MWPELSETKTRLIRFTRFIPCNNESFIFLGFEFRWEIARSGKPVVRLKTAKKKFKLAIQSIKSWIKGCHSTRIRELMQTYKSKLQGHWNYYGVSGNFEMLQKYYWNANRIVFKWLNRRSQRKSFNWNGFSKVLVYYKIPRPKIVVR